MRNFILIVLMGLISSCSPISEQKAKQILKAEFEKFCEEKGYKQEDFTSPSFVKLSNPTHVLLGTWEFKKIKGSYVMIHVDNYGDTDFAYDNFPPVD